MINGAIVGAKCGAGPAAARQKFGVGGMKRLIGFEPQRRGFKNAQTGFRCGYCSGGLEKRTSVTEAVIVISSLSDHSAARAAMLAGTFADPPGPGGTS
jgi:hypothetical protein